MRIVISNASPDPIYEQITVQIKHQIMTGALAEGEQLPSIRRLAAELGVSVITTKRVYDDLEREGFINTVNGKGSFIALQNGDLLHERKLKVVEAKLNAAVEEARLLGIPAQELVTMLKLLYEEV